MSIEQTLQEAETIVENRGASIMRRIIERFNGSTNSEEKDQLVGQAYAEHDRQQTENIPDEEEQINILIERRKKPR